MTPKLVRPQTLADRWSSSTGQLANMRSAGTGPAYVKIGTRVMYRLADVIAYEDAATVDTSDSRALAGAR